MCISSEVYRMYDLQASREQERRIKRLYVKVNEHFAQTLQMLIELDKIENSKCFYNDDI